MTRAEQVAPFQFDTWPLCEPWERAGLATFHDTLEVSRWGAQAQLQLQLEIDRRFDQLRDRVLASSWPAIELP